MTYPHLTDNCPYSRDLLGDSRGKHLVSLFPAGASAIYIFVPFHKISHANDSHSCFILLADGSHTIFFSSLIIKCPGNDQVLDD